MTKNQPDHTASAPAGAATIHIEPKDADAAPDHITDKALADLIARTKCPPSFRDLILSIWLPELVHTHPSAPDGEAADDASSDLGTDTDGE